MISFNFVVDLFCFSGVNNNFDIGILIVVGILGGMFNCSVMQWDVVVIVNDVNGMVVNIMLY